MEELVYRYQNSAPITSCHYPLCVATPDCDQCPWNVLTKEDCLSVLLCSQDQEKKNRIRQLRRWINAYEIVLREREKGGLR